MRMPPILFEGLPEIIPEGELAGFPQVQRAESVGIAEIEQRPVACPRLWLE